MDQDAFKKTYNEVNERYCAFEKGILTNQCRCSMVKKLCIAEREAAQCKSDESQLRCITYLEVLRDKARFALKLSENGGSALPHAKAIRLQIGGLRGLQAALAEDDQPGDQIEDVADLLRRAFDRFDGFQRLPFSLIMQQIANYQGRKPSRRKR